MELAQVRLLVTDFAACYRFYAEVLGLKPQSGAAEGPYEKFSPASGSAGIALQDRSMMAEVLGELGDTATGHRSLVGPMALAGAAVGADGLIIEVHPDPANARCFLPVLPPVPVTQGNIVVNDASAA